MKYELTKPQETSFQKLYARGSSPQDKSLTDDLLKLIICASAFDLSLSLEEMPEEMPNLFSSAVDDDFKFPVNIDVKRLYANLITLNPNSETYVACLAQLLRARLKFVRILRTQPFATMEQVAPRSLLQFGTLPNSSLASLLIWRKWLYDVDNRAAQDTGYLFEPIIAASIGGVPYGHKKSPIKRLGGTGGRQVDAIKDSFAYEFKIRITIAASGQGRWAEELSFPSECVESGFTPVLVVLDSTENAKLTEITEAYEAAGGICYAGDAAWQHLRAQAGDEMGIFLKKYIEEPIKAMVHEECVRTVLEPLTLKENDGEIQMQLGEDVVLIPRINSMGELTTEKIPDDASDFLPGSVFF